MDNYLSEHVKISNVDDESVVLEVRPVKPGMTYTLSFDDSFKGEFIKEAHHISGVSSTCEIKDFKKGIVHINFDNNLEEDAHFYAIFDNSDWINSHIDSIKSQLVEQVSQAKYDVEIAKQLAKIESTIRNQGYATLIQNLIRSHAGELTNMQVMDIQGTLTSVKEDKGLTPRQTYRFGL